MFVRIALCQLFIVVFAAVTCYAQTINFEDVTLPGGGVLAANGADITLFSGGAGFNADWNETFNCCAAGWAFSNHTDNTTASFTNSFSAITGSSFGGGSTYAVAFEDTFNNVVPTISLPSGLVPQSVRITNTTYTYFSMLNGDGFAKAFGDDLSDGYSGTNEGFPDYFKVTVTGKDSGGGTTGAIDFYLADYRAADNADDYIVDDWELLDLTSLGSSTQFLEFRLETTDVGMFGANTPFYFAIDDLVLAPASSLAVPEPSSLLAIIVCAIALLAGGRKFLRMIK